MNILFINIFCRCMVSCIDTFIYSLEGFKFNLFGYISNILNN